MNKVTQSEVVFSPMLMSVTFCGVICVCSLIKNPAERADLKMLMVGVFKLVFTHLIV